MAAPSFLVGPTKKRMTPGRPKVVMTRQRTTTNVTTLFFFVFVWVFLVVFESPQQKQRHGRIIGVVQAQQPDLSCDLSADTCSSQFDGICDRNCGLDCFDCDECTQFELNCGECLANNCHYCPGDGTCRNSDRYQITNVISSCETPNDWLQQRSDGGVVCASNDASQVFNDPEYAGQAWVYDMIQVEAVWRDMGYTGQGVHVRINDNAVQANHPEFQGRFDVESSCEDSTNPNESTSSDGSSLNPSHGTHVAGIVGAAANNEVCSVGIAPGVTLSACVAVGSRSGTTFLTHTWETYDISQNSHGIDGCQALVRKKKRRRDRRELQLQPPPPDDTETITTTTSCPFTYEEIGVPSPCQVCEFGIEDDDDDKVLSDVCQGVIREHCRRFYAQDTEACLDVLDIVLGGKCNYVSLPEEYRKALVQGITQGRQGKGIIYVFASGNAKEFGDDTNFQPYTNSRFIITVGAVSKGETQASYSTPGASLFVSAPGGDSGYVSNHITAGLDGSCQQAGIGTSFACPVVSGVVALMLEANPELSWRDVQHILARTSRRVRKDENDETDMTNAAGFWHSHAYGFGIVHAASAVKTAEDWINIGSEQMLLVESGLINLPIVDEASQTLNSTLTFSAGAANFFTESVVVQLDLEHKARGHLEIILTSPSGTQSIVLPGNRPENGQTDEEERLKVLTVRNWGEDPFGDWILSITDLKEGNVGSENCISDASWEIETTTQPIDCAFLAVGGFCRDGELDPSGLLSPAQYQGIFEVEVNGLLAQDACCECGGLGVPLESVTDTLKQWTLVVYGYSLDGDDSSEGPILINATPAPTSDSNSTDDSSTLDNVFNFTSSDDLFMEDPPSEAPVVATTDPPETPRPTAGPTLVPSSSPDTASGNTRSAVIPASTGLSMGAKIGIGIGIPIVVLGLWLIGAYCYLRYERSEASLTKVQSPTVENDEGFPNNDEEEGEWEDEDESEEDDEGSSYEDGESSDDDDDDDDDDQII